MAIIKAFLRDEKSYIQIQHKSIITYRVNLTTGGETLDARTHAAAVIYIAQCVAHQYKQDSSLLGKRVTIQRTPGEGKTHQMVVKNQGGKATQYIERGEENNPRFEPAATKRKVKGKGKKRVRKGKPKKTARTVPYPPTVTFIKRNKGEKTCYAISTLHSLFQTYPEVMEKLKDIDDPTEETAKSQSKIDQARQTLLQELGGIYKLYTRAFTTEIKSDAIRFFVTYARTLMSLTGEIKEEKDGEIDGIYFFNFMLAQLHNQFTDEPLLKSLPDELGEEVKLDRLGNWEHVKDMKMPSSFHLIKHGALLELVKAGKPAPQVLLITVDRPDDEKENKPLDPQPTFEVGTDVKYELRAVMVFQGGHYITAVPIIGKGHTFTWVLDTKDGKGQKNVSYRLAQDTLDGSKTQELFKRSRMLIYRRVK